jgi:thiol-disulfide isomerase/thioredoxin
MKLSGRVGRSAAELLSFEGRLPGFGGANGWLDSGPLSPDDLRGHVVLVNFWTFTCVNWLRTAPYIRAWADKYKQQGLVTIGVHTPEFDVEHDFGNLERMVKDLRVDYPVAIDNDYAVWDAFTNNAWPAVYLADGEGALRYQHLGEGNYEESERAIQELLGVEDDLVSVEGSGLEAPADWENVRSPETYVGYARAEGFASPGGIAVGERHAYSLPEELGLNRWALSGEWTIGPQAAVLNEPGGRLTYRFHARDLNLVLAPPENGGEIALRVLLDGEPPGEAHGEDIDEQGDGTVSEPRLYQLVRQSGRITDRTFEITFRDPGAQVYVFTFG